MAKILDLIDDDLKQSQSRADTAEKVRADQSQLTADQAAAEAAVEAQAASEAALVAALKLAGPVLAGGTTLYEAVGDRLRVQALPDAAGVDVPGAPAGETPAPAPPPAPTPAPAPAAAATGRAAKSRYG